MRFSHKFSIVLTVSLVFLSFTFGAPISVSSDDKDVAARSVDVGAEPVSDLAIRALRHEHAQAVLRAQAARKDIKGTKKKANANKSQAQIRAGRQAAKDARRNALNAKVRAAAARRPATRARAATRRANRKAQGIKAPPPQTKNVKNQMKADWRQLAPGSPQPPRRATQRNPKIGPQGLFPTKPVVRTSTKPKRVRSAAGKKKARANYKKNARVKKAARVNAPGGRVVRPLRQQISKNINDAGKYMQSTVSLPGRKQEFKYSRTAGGRTTNVEQTGLDVRKGIMNGQLYSAASRQGLLRDPGRFGNYPYPAGHPLAGQKPLTNGGREYPVVSGNLGWQEDPGQNRGAVRVVTSNIRNTAGRTVPKFEGVLTHDSTYVPPSTRTHWNQHYRVPSV